ncbi:MAG: VWA domain-containing protein [Acidobacteria bacterium]|nr:VWA domain-containing protein [Acidobacteriota bacterium]
MQPVAISLAVLMLIPVGVGTTQRLPGTPQTAFRSGVDLVRVTAVVRDEKGRIVRNLTRNDFVVIDSGIRRPIADFSSAETPLSLALLFDVSGSMEVAGKVEAARRAADHLVSWLKPGKDEAALFTFDAELRELLTFTKETGALRSALQRLAPYGSTSLHDAIAAAARRVAGRSTGRRAVLVITDGIDTSSHLSAREVSGVASSIDVPVYILAVVPPVDHPGADTAAANAARSPLAGELVDLASWTGGHLFVTSAPAHASVAARQIVSELRHQYLIAFESAGTSGWHPLDIQTRDRKLTVRARSGYVAGKPGAPSAAAALGWKAGPSPVL